MFEKHLWNSFLLYLVVENLQLVHEIAASWRGSIKEVFWKTSQTLQINTKNSHPGVLCQKRRCSKTFGKFTEKYLCRSLFLNKFADSKLKTFRSSHCRCSAKQGALKNFANFIGYSLYWSLFSIKLQFWWHATLLKKTRTQVLSSEIWYHFEEHLWMSTSKLYLKRSSNIGVFAWILWIIQEHLFCR